MPDHPGNVSGRTPTLGPEDLRNWFVKLADEQVGDTYQFGAEAADDDVDPTAFDSSELVEWAAHRSGVRGMPDGSWNQYRWLHERGGAVSVEEALQTKGALVFGFSSDPLASPDRPARAYVGISVGDGKNVIDVSERAGEVKVMPAGDLYTHGAKIAEFDGTLPPSIPIDTNGDGVPDSSLRAPFFPGEVDTDGDGVADSSVADPPLLTPRPPGRPVLVPDRRTTEPGPGDVIYEPYDDTVTPGGPSGRVIPQNMSGDEDLGPASEPDPADLRVKDPLQEKAGLLSTAESWENDAAQYEAQGDTLSAELHRGQAANLRAQADAIKPVIPEVDQRIVDAADQPWGPPDQADPGASNPGVAGASGNSAVVDPVNPGGDDLTALLRGNATSLSLDGAGTAAASFLTVADAAPDPDPVEAIVDGPGDMTVDDVVRRRGVDPGALAPAADDPVGASGYDAGSESHGSGPEGAYGPAGLEPDGPNAADAYSETVPASTGPIPGDTGASEAYGEPSYPDGGGYEAYDDSYDNTPT